MTMTIRTNNQERALVSGYELTASQKADFDYLDDIDSADFVIYKGHVYDIGEFMRVETDGPLQGWHGYSADSFFSGVLIKLSDCGGYATLATYSA